MKRSIRYALLGVAGLLALSAALIVLPIAVGIVAGYLSAPRPAPKTVELVRYVDRPSTAASAAQHTPRE